MALQKQYTVKIFDQDGTTFLKNISPANERRNVPTFSSNINGGFSPVVLDFVNEYKFDDFNEGTEVEFMNIVEIDAVDEDNPRGRTIFKGFISKYEPYIRGNGDEGVVVTVPHLSSLLSFSYYKDGASFTVSHSAEDPEAIAQAIIDHFNTIYSGSLLSYTAASTDTVGTNVTIDFSDKKWFDALREIGKLAGTGWWWKIDETGVYYLLAKPSSATHTFTIGRNIDEIIATKDSEKVINDVQVRRSGGTTSNYTDATSQATYGTGSPATGKRTKIVSDTDINDATTADQRGNKLIADNKDSKINAKITINDNYDLESIKVGETCKIRNFDYDNTFFNDNMQIVSLTYKGNKVVIALGQEPSNFGRELDEFVNPSG